MIREITCADVDVSIHVEEEHVPVRGNAVYSDNKELDKQVEDSILEKLEAGDAWAWCCVRVHVSFKGILSSNQYLGCCSYKDEDDFASGGYLDDMIKEGVDEINKTIKSLFEALSTEAETT